MQKIFFYHVTRTAGNSLRNVLRNNYDNSAIYDSCADGQDPNAGSDFLYNRPELFSKHSCFMGHYRSNILPLIPEDFFLFTFLRHPVSRAVSWFYYLKKIGLLSSKMKIENFFYDVPELPIDYKCNAISYFKQATNTYVRFFGNHLDKGFHEINRDHYQDALDSLSKRFDFIGFQEKYEESTFILSKICNFDNIFYERLRATSESKKSRNLKEELSEDLYNRIVEFNTYDIELYERTLEKYNNHFNNFILTHESEFEKSKKNRPEKAALKDAFFD